MALRMVEDAERSGALKPGGTIIEGTSGNTGMGLALAAIVKGYRCIFTTTDKQSREKVDALRAFGAEVVVCPTDVDPEDPRSYYSVSSRLVAETPNSWKPNQYDNLSNSAAHYESTGPEIWEQTEGKVAHLVVGVGTGGTICVQVFVLIASAARRLIGVDVRAVGKRVASMATDPGLPGRLTTRVPSVTGIIRQAALRHWRYKTG